MKKHRKTTSNKRMDTKLSCRLMTLVLACLVFAPIAQAVVPAPDGGYPGFNTAEGQKALFSLTTGVANTAVGWSSLSSNTDGSFNTGIGTGTLLFNLGNQSTGEGVRNTATGAGALLSNSLGFQNTANGAFALFSNTEGVYNTAIGESTLFFNTIGSGNTGVGVHALYSNSMGGDNTAVGATALSSNTQGSENTAIGAQALLNNTLGLQNTAHGAFALRLNTTGNNNTATGYRALVGNVSGVENTAHGHLALANCTGSYNVGLAGGFNLTNGDFNIDIGNDGEAGESGTIRIGSFCCQSRAFIAGISGVTVSGGATVYVKSDGQLGTSTSSARFKQDIRNMDKASETLLGLRPVTFRYKQELDPEGIPQFGLIAEEVEQVNPDLVVRDENGKAYSVRYDQVNAMLLNEFLKQHRRVEEQKTAIVELKSALAKQREDFEAATTQQQKTFQCRFAEQEKQIAALASGLQEVSAQFNASKPDTRFASAISR
jgi:hypothetical protein